MTTSAVTLGNIQSQSVKIPRDCTKHQLVHVYPAARQNKKCST